MISFGVSDVISAPVLTKMRRPSTKALKRRSLTSTILMPDLDRPAALQDRPRHSRAPALRSRHRARSGRSAVAPGPAALPANSARPAITATAVFLANAGSWRLRCSRSCSNRTGRLSPLAAERQRVRYHELVIPTAFGHLCGAPRCETRGSQLRSSTMALSISRRGAVEPFHAMDVLAEANRLKSLGHPVISMAVGQPSDPAPAAVRDAAARALRDGRIGYTDSLACAACARRSPRTTASTTALPFRRSGWRWRPAHRRHSTSPFSPCSMPAIGSRWQRPAIRPTATSSRRSASRSSKSISRRRPPDGRPPAAAHAETPLNGVLFASPANPTGAIIPAADLEELIAVARRARDIGDFRRDLSPARLFGAGHHCARLQRRHRRDQFLFQILLHDRLADRLDGAAGDAGAADRAPPAVALYLSAGTVADRGDRRRFQRPSNSKQ